jgi:hypothetical protein
MRHVSMTASALLLDPAERAGEILFGVIVVLTFTGTISVEGGATDTRTVLKAAVACNLAWGIVDAAMYLLATFADRARNLATLRALRRSRNDDAARRLLLGALPPLVASVLTPVEVEAVCDRLTRLPEPSFAPLTHTDLLGAAGVCLLVFLSTFPIVIPFIVLRDVSVALRASNIIAIVMMFAAGWSLGRYTGRQGWQTGLATMAVGVVLVGVTIALGG